MTFISFEGCDFVGKSTQIKLLAADLTKLGKKVHLTREPGGSQLAERIRSVLLTATEIKDPLTEYLLLAAGRKDHVENVIKPKLKESYFVLSDRFFDSSLCYQGYVKGLQVEIIKQIQDFTIANFQPDVSILLTLSEQELFRRINNKQRQGHNAYDDKEAEFHLNVQENFKKIAAESGDRFITVSTDAPKEEVHQEIITALKEKKIL
jgi:dTMP kinase